ncbi:unnamed protein product [Linum tenue]|uniref:F-box domain-containing protein n=1 Tax=Linum tenue TaxID=586396 RepID=A0AAV0NII1_9ROSI|nr:unnamed protein product [Linum tenue]
MEGRFFPEDLMMSEILVRLPIFCLVRFRCVCKSWYSLLSDPKFLYKTLFLVENDHRRDDTKILVKLKLNPADPLLYCSLSYDSLQVEIPYRDFPNPNPNYKQPGSIMSACGIKLAELGLREGRRMRHRNGERARESLFSAFDLYISLYCVLHVTKPERKKN